MKKSRIISLLLAATFIFPFAAHAYSTTGIKWYRFPGTPATVDVDPATNRTYAQENAIWFAMNAWTNAGANFYYVDTSTSGHDFRDYYDSGSSNLAIAYTTWVLGRYTNMHVSVNTAKPWATDGSAGYYDFQSMAAHELGHTLGLDHSSNSEATMYSSMSSGETKKRSLHSDDISGIQSIY